MELHGSDILLPPHGRLAIGVTGTQPGAAASYEEVRQLRHLSRISDLRFRAKHGPALTVKEIAVHNFFIVLVHATAAPDALSQTVARFDLVRRSRYEGGGLGDATTVLAVANIPNILCCGRHQMLGERVDGDERFLQGERQACVAEPLPWG
jgi:hypothetical protein